VVWELEIPVILFFLIEPLPVAAGCQLSCRTASGPKTVIWLKIAIMWQKVERVFTLKARQLNIPIPFSSTFYQNLTFWGLMLDTHSAIKRKSKFVCDDTVNWTICWAYIRGS
jgi:hypothetical protein